MYYVLIALGALEAAAQREPLPPPPPHIIIYYFRPLSHLMLLHCIVLLLHYLIALRYHAILCAALPLTSLCPSPTHSR